MTTHDIGRRLRCYGHGSVSSPNLDALAREGVRYASCFCTAPQCSPSRASLASGMYPHNNGVMGLAHHGFDWELAVPHAAAMFTAAGFEAHLFGGQHVTLHDERLGFTRIHGEPNDREIEEVLASPSRLYVEINFSETHRPYPPVPDGATAELPPFMPDSREARHEFAALNLAIERMDQAAGRVLEALDQAGRADKT